MYPFHTGFKLDTLMFYSTNTLVCFWGFSLFHSFLIIPSGDHENVSSYPNFLYWPSLTTRLHFSGDRKASTSKVGLRHCHVFLMGMQNSTKKKKKKKNLTHFCFDAEIPLLGAYPKVILQKLKNLYVQYYIL